MKMKYILSTLIGSAMIVSSCVNLDYNEISTTDEEWVYDSPLYGVQKLVTDIYAHLQYDFGNSMGGAMYASAADESEYVYSMSSVHKFYNGSWSPVTPLTDTWGIAYSAIAEANTFLEKWDLVSLKDYIYNEAGAGDMAYDKLLAKFEMFPYEVRFLRAYFYFELVKTYGDVPLVTKSLSNAEANAVVRTPAQEVFRYIMNECDQIAEFLPITFATELSRETGRASRAMVLALKAKTLLYAASPLYNKEGNKELWKEAAKATKDLLDRSKEWGISLGKYSNLWGDGSFRNQEIIFGRPVGNLNYFERYNYPVGVENGESGNCPTQSLVDAYEYQSDGKTFGEKWSSATVNLTQAKPYEGLDPRFELTVVRNGDNWPTYNTHPIETFEGGRNGSPIYGATTTGYYLKKYCDGSVNISTNNANQKRHTYIIYRLAEFYLNYAEAMFQYYGDADTKGDFGMSANQAINMLRNRSDIKMPEFKGNNDFLKRYERERMVELAFEGQRFWDVRRWKKGELYLGTIEVASLKQDGNGDIILTRAEKNRGWYDKYYLFPIPFSEMQINKRLVQNPGW